MEEIEEALREMFKENKKVALNEDGHWVAQLRIEASKACAQIAMTLVEIQEQRLEEETE